MGSLNYGKYSLSKFLEQGQLSLYAVYVELNWDFFTLFLFVLVLLSLILQLANFFHHLQVLLLVRELITINYFFPVFRVW